MESITYFLQLSISEYKKKIATIFNAPVDQIYLSDEFVVDHEQYVTVFQQILYLSSLYNLRHVTTQKVVFKSEAKCYGKVTSGLKTGQNITCINFGDNPRAAFSSGRFSKRLSENVKDKLVVTHEFAHVLSGSERATEPVEKRYWQELTADYWQPYKKAASSLANSGSLISEYSVRNIDEFHAEAFTEYHLCDHPSEIAVEVGELINEYFIKK